MKIKNLCIFFLPIIASLWLGYFFGQENNIVSAQVKPDSKKSLFNLLKNENILTVSRYEDDDNGERFAIHRKLNKPVEKDSILKTSEQLSIYDEKGIEIFSKIDFVISRFYFLYLTRNSKQMVIETNGGGTDNFLEIYDYKNGKFTEIIDPFETQMRDGGYWMTPEYRTGLKSPYFKPSQIFVIGQIGGGDENPSATLFRYKNGKYKSVGEIKMQELGDFIESHISKK